MQTWADKLIGEYKVGREGLTTKKNKLDPEILEDKQDRKQINSMFNDMSYSIEWMESGRQPGLYRGVDKKNAYRKKQYDEIEIIPDITEQLEREPLYMSQEQRRITLDLLRNFSHRERECFVMHEAEQLSMQQIADKLNLKKRTVQQYIERAREKVKKISA
ncbi:LuxR C-terminal-related transcriptional regulator [Virgibacillus sp. AGTR]|uniref:sigma factor-like helix-turn-helix DNA-binding protein n=1 Tax=Virgibacillus sp. AGTR TaxID=2812055 RepID=UPI001D169A7C|nr:sigma factor-like helix-turn-helix DNA-binding protein [Virgibacillus sp. AGTR]MCC2250066.1 LuxR C-terminal-related transcriptional regulator [Virgibacillus sp. AGTR]